MNVVLERWAENIKKLKLSNFLELTKILKTLTTIFGIKFVNIRFVIEFNVSVSVMDKISNYPSNSTRTQDAHYFRNRGPSIKYATLEGEGVREGVTVCDRGRGVKSM